ncbi:response regulator [bacterium]|nr:response regulator [bacterium]
MNTVTTEQPAAGTQAGAPVQVLAIDDNEEFCSLVKQLLEPLGYQVTTISNPVKALELYTRQKESFDLVLLDYFMPALDGVKTFEWLRKLNPRAKVILCSGADELRLRQLMAQHAIDGYIHKPFRLQEALFIIKQVMAKPATDAQRAG